MGVFGHVGFGHLAPPYHCGHMFCRHNMFRDRTLRSQALVSSGFSTYSLAFPYSGNRTEQTTQKPTMHVPTFVALSGAYLAPQLYLFVSRHTIFGDASRGDLCAHVGWVVVRRACVL